jgi:hypothetical protein
MTMTETPDSVAAPRLGPMTTFVRSTRRALTSLLLSGALLLTGAVLTASPAQAARAINPPAGFFCDSSTARVAVSPPRIWATRGTEQILWATTLQRWNASTGQWYNYASWQDWASYNYYGQNVSPMSWGPKYVNNYMRYPVSHVGYYRVKSYVASNQGGASWLGFVSGGAYCYIN